MLEVGTVFSDIRALLSRGYHVPRIRLPDPVRPSMDEDPPQAPSTDESDTTALLAATKINQPITIWTRLKAWLLRWSYEAIIHGPRSGTERRHSKNVSDELVLVAVLIFTFCAYLVSQINLLWILLLTATGQRYASLRLT